MEKKKSKKKVEFSKIVVIFALSLVAFIAISEVALAWFGRQLIDNFAIACINVFGAFCCGGYFTLTGYRDGTLNKHGIHLDGNDKHYIETPTPANGI